MRRERGEYQEGVVVGGVVVDLRGGGQEGEGLGELIALDEDGAVGGEAPRGWRGRSRRTLSARQI